MSIYEEDRQDAAVAQQVAQVLSDAGRRAVRSGHAVVYVKDGVLVRQTTSGTTVLKTMPTRRKVTKRTKKARS